MIYRIAILSLSLLALVSKGDLPGQVGWPLRKAFIPMGFDDNDKVQITVSGEFPNTCFHVGPYQAKVDEKSSTIFLRQQAYAYSAMCLQILMPFTQVIDVGMVPAGSYRVVDAPSGVQLGTTSISRASNSGPDDYLYAIVDDAVIHHVPGTVGKNEITLSLRFTDRCTRLGRLDIHYYADSIVVQPIADRAVNEKETCAVEQTRLQYTEPLKDGLTGSFLLHVRSMNGQAINKIVDFE